MSPPMIGNWIVTVHAVRPFTIHGDQYFELQVERAEHPGALLAIRIPQHAAKTAPTPGQRLELTFLMGQVTTANPA